MPRLSGVARGYARQPTQFVPPDWNNQLTKGLVSLTNFGVAHGPGRAWDAVTRTPWTQNGTTTAAVGAKGRMMTNGAAGSLSNAGLVPSTKITGPWTVFMIASASASVTGVYFSATTASAPYCACFSGTWSISNSANGSVAGNGTLQTVAFRQTATIGDVTVNGIKGTGNAQNYAAFAAGAATLGDFGPSGGFPITGSVALMAVFNRALTDNEIQSLTRNPWQLFAQPSSLARSVAIAGQVYAASVTEVSNAQDTITRDGPGSYTASVTEASTATDAPSALATLTAAMAEAGVLTMLSDWVQQNVTLKQYWKQFASDSALTLQTGSNPLTATAGTTLVCALTGYNGPSVTIAQPTDSAGTFSVPTDGTTSAILTGARGFCHYLSAQANAAGGSHSITPPTVAAGNQACMWIFEIANMPLALGVRDVQGAQSSSTTSPWSLATGSGSGTGVQAGDLVIAFGSYDGSSGAILTGGMTTPSGFTRIGLEDTAGNLFSPAEVSYRVVGSAGAVTPAWTTTDTSKDYDLALTLTLKTAVTLYLASLTEASTAAEVQAAQLLGVAAQAEAGTASDAPSATLLGVAAMAESGAATDTQATQAALTAAGTATGAATDTQAAQAALGAAVAEAGTAGDAQSAAAQYASAVAEAANATDVTDAQALLSAALAEVLAAADSTSLQGASYTAVLAEVLAAVDAQDGQRVVTASQDEALTAADIVGAAALLAAVQEEAGLVLDLQDAAAVLEAALAELGDAQDAQDAIQQLTADMAEQLNAVDAVLAITALLTVLRVYRFAAEQRAYVAEAENRAFTFEAEDRAYRFPGESRTHRF